MCVWCAKERTFALLGIACQDPLPLLLGSMREKTWNIYVVCNKDSTSTIHSTWAMVSMRMVRSWREVKLFIITCHAPIP